MEIHSRTGEQEKGRIIETMVEMIEMMLVAREGCAAAGDSNMIKQ